MAKITLITFGSLQVKMDTGDTDSYDAKKPHVSFVVRGYETIPHVYLDEVDNLVGNDWNEKDAIYWLRDHKEELIRQYHSLDC